MFIYFFFYFSVALVVRGEKSPQLRAFFPALLPAVSLKYPGIGEILPSRDTVVHNAVDFPDFPLFRLVTGVRAKKKQETVP